MNETDIFATGFAIVMGLSCAFIYDRFSHNGESRGNEMLVNLLVFSLSTLIMVLLYAFLLKERSESTQPKDTNKSINQKIIDSQMKPMSDAIKKGAL